MNQKLSLSVILLCYMVLSPVSLARQASQQIYFGCEQNFQFETKNDAARCIQEERLSYKPPQRCIRGGTKYRNYRLVIDYQGLNDMCVLSLERLKTESRTSVLAQSHSQSKNFIPSCSMGFTLIHHKGKDTCILKKPEIIRAPNRMLKLRATTNK